MTIQEAAAMLSVASTTIYALIERGVLTVVRVVPFGLLRKRRYLRRADVEALARLQAGSDKEGEDAR